MIKSTVRVLALAAASLVLSAGAASAAEPMPPAQHDADESALSSQRKAGAGHNENGGWMTPGNPGDGQFQPGGASNAPDQPDQPVLMRVMEDVLGL
ncbi:hypothetical protein QOM21_01945 [Streptomyces sp. Pv4-95]|uniref:hypothetical protein n=1 Tax=Streptomyces sp. Pv4-95 TaxID=3049543 RepID=UPI003892BA4C